jgi:hypothetical protein
VEQRKHGVGHASEVMVQKGCEWELNWHGCVVTVLQVLLMVRRDA